MGKMKSKYFLISFGTGLIAGILIGATALTILVSYRMDKLYENLAALENVINEKDAKLKKLEESINTMYFVLQDIEIIVEFIGEDAGDEIDRIEIEKAIKEKYTELLGKEVKSIDPDLVVKVVDQRIFKLDEKEYRLRVSKLLLSETLKLWVEAQLVE
ncbi:MAG TPA: hypothetical protein GXX53_05190 [Tissierellia bacterium]|nr:hypothetical protein [Tissierellia bacterium]